MKVKQLSKKEFQTLDRNSECYLCEVTLGDYILGLKPNFDEYKIQRGIVANKYLDSMVDTLVKSDHIPVITLVLDDWNNIVFDSDGFLIEVKDAHFDILDGLQRTARIKTVLDTIDCVAENQDEFRQIPSFALRSKLSKIGSSISIAKSIVAELECKSIRQIQEVVLRNRLWVEIWVGLNEEEIVDKMLLLNAGHKQVKMRHQLEILFFNLQEHIEKKINAQITLTKEKYNVSVASFAKNREIGEFKLADIILGFIALKEKNYKITGSRIVEANQKLSEEETLEGNYKIVYQEVIDYLLLLLEIDKIIIEKYPKDGRAWFAKETVIVGFSSALGMYLSGDMINKEAIITLFKEHINSLNLRDYEEHRNNMQSSKVNIGDVTKRVVNHCLLAFLKCPQKAIDWANAFNIEV